jgi:hypothetical protein
MRARRLAQARSMRLSAGRLSPPPAPWSLSSQAFFSTPTDLFRAVPAPLTSVEAFFGTSLSKMFTRAMAPGVSTCRMVAYCEASIFCCMCFPPSVEPASYQRSTQ